MSTDLPRDPSSPGLIGRTREQAGLDALVAAGRRDGSAALLVGEPGTGRSALLSYAARAGRLTGSEVLLAVGSHAEAGVPYAGLHQLLQPILPGAGGRSASPDLPTAQDRALSTALQLQLRSSSAPFLVALATLEVLVQRAMARGPLLLLADDLNRFDHPTQEVLAFVARRVASHRLLVLATAHPGSPGPFQAAGLPEILLGPLPEAEARALLQRDGGPRDTVALEEILVEAKGNPLALRELRTLPRRSAASWPEESRPLSARLVRSFADGLSTLSPDTQNAVLVAALDDVGEIRDVVAATALMTERPATAAVLAPAVAAGLLSLTTLHVRFRHPLTRAAVLDRAIPDRRQAAAAALAAVVEDPYRRARYRSASVVGPDENVADGLAAATLARSGPRPVLATIHDLERSARLSPDPQKRTQRLVAAARHAVAAGRGDLVDLLAEQASSSTVTEVDLARLRCAREVFEEASADPARVDRLANLAGRAAASGDLDSSLELLVAAAWRCWWADDQTAPAERVCSMARRWHGGARDPRFLATLALGRPLTEGAGVLALLSDVALGDVSDSEQLHLLGTAAFAAGSCVLARRFLVPAAAALRREGRDGTLTAVLALLAEVELALGAWDRSTAAASETQELAARTGQSRWHAQSLVLQATCRALRGDGPTALGLVTRVETDSAAGGHHRMLAGIRLARGVNALSTGSYGQAYLELEQLFDRADGPAGLGGTFAALGHYVEAAAHSDHGAEASAVILGLESATTSTPPPDLEVQLLYGRALLAEEAEAEALHRQTQEMLMASPWLRARSQLAYAGWLRRRYRVAESRAPLGAALATFEALRAPGWAGRARAELRAAGMRLSGEAPALMEVLSPQEQQIVHYAAAGLTNREIGERLYLSPRTVGSHLYRVFPKLGVTSRVQLSGRVTALTGREAVG